MRHRQITTLKIRTTNIIFYTDPTYHVAVNRGLLSATLFYLQSFVFCSRGQLPQFAEVLLITLSSSFDRGVKNIEESRGIH
jgi:hypothetical protein